MDFSADYRRHVDQLKTQFPDQRKSMSLAVGGDFDGMGFLQRELLIFLGLKPTDFLVDVVVGRAAR